MSEESDVGSTSDAEIASHAPARIPQRKPRRKRCALSVEQRVQHIEGLMEALTFQRGKTCRILAAEWGVALATVEGNAAEASRRVTGDKEEITRDITVAARRLMRTALIARDYRGWTSVATLAAAVTGANAPVKQDIVFEGASPAKTREVMASLFGSAVAPEIDSAADPEAPREPSK